MSQKEGRPGILVIKINYLGLNCVASHPVVNKLLDKDVLTVFLHAKWEITRREEPITNK